MVKLLNQPSSVETVSIQLDRNIKIQSQPFISNLPGSQELGKPSFLQVQYNFPLGLTFLAKESHHCDFQKIALRKKFLACQQPKM